MSGSMAAGNRRRLLLQVAVDVTDLDQALRLVERVHEYCDIVEVGTPLLIEQGLAAMEAMKRRFPGKLYLADVKIADAGRLEAGSAFARGADYVTVLGVVDDATVQGALAAAEAHGGRLMADLMYVSDQPTRARQLDAMGVHAVCLHTAFDRQGRGIDPLAELHAVRPVVGRAQVAIAGGITLANAPAAVRRGADILVVGGGIITRPDPAAAARAIRACMEEALADGDVAGR